MLVDTVMLCLCRLPTYGTVSRGKREVGRDETPCPRASAAQVPHTSIPVAGTAGVVLDSKYFTVATVVSSTSIRATVRLQCDGEQISPRNLTGFVFVTSKKVLKDQGDVLMLGWCFSVALHCT